MAEIAEIVFKIDGVWYRVPFAELKNYAESPVLAEKAELQRKQVQQGKAEAGGLSYVAAYADSALEQLSAAGGHIDIDPTGGTSAD